MYNNIQKLKQMGFSSQMIEQAKHIAEKKKMSILDVLIKMQFKQEQNNPKNHFKQQIKDIDHQYTCIYDQDVGQNINHFLINEKRQSGIPVGLKNVSNCCYLNSILQSYFFIPIFYKTIINFIPPQTKFLDKIIGQNTIKYKTVLQSIYLVQSMKKLFSKMSMSNKKVLDPSPILLNWVDQFGNRILLGQQKDLCEINMLLISRIQQALDISEKLKKHQLNKSTNQIFNTSDKKSLRQLFLGEKIQMFQGSQEIQKSTFFGLILNPQTGNLQQALQEQRYYSVRNLQKQEQTKKQMWITKAPVMLLLQIQRVTYKPDIGLVKINTKFDLSKNIYIDRHMFENRKNYLQKKSILQKLYKEYSKQKYIEMLQNYISLTNSLKILHPLLPIEFPEPPSTQILLNKIKQYQDDIENAKQQINKIYKGMNKTNYKLYATFMHQGQANTGHYWVNIRVGNKWFRMNDSNVKEVDQKSVIQQAIGNKQTNAYALIYQKQNYIQNSNLIPNFKTEQNLVLQRQIQQIDLLNGDQNKVHTYQSIISDSIYHQIINQNIKLDKIIQNYTIKSTAQQILIQYEKRFQLVNQTIRKNKQKNIQNNQKVPLLNNFACFLRNLTPGPNMTFKYNLLDICIRKHSKYNIVSIKQKQKLCKKIQQLFKQNLNEFKIIDKFVFEKQDIKQLQNKFDMFLNYLKASKCILYMFEAQQKQKLHNCLASAYFIYNLNITDCYYYKMCKDVSKMIFLKYLLKIFKNRQKYENLGEIIVSYSLVMTQDKINDQLKSLIMQLELGGLCQLYANNKLDLKNEKVVEYISFKQNVLVYLQQFKEFYEKQKNLKLYEWQEISMQDHLNNNINKKLKQFMINNKSYIELMKHILKYHQIIKGKDWNNNQNNQQILQ